MATVADVARKEIEGILALLASSGKTFPCIDSKHHQWSKAYLKTDRICDRCQKKYKWPRYYGQRERDELIARRDRMMQIVREEESRAATNTGNTARG